LLDSKAFFNIFISGASMKFLQQVFLSVFTISLCMTPRTSYALSEKAAAYIPICGGVAIGAAVGSVSHITIKRPLATALTSIVAGGVSWVVLHHYLSKLTPKNKINAAIKIVQMVKTDPFFSQHFVTMKEFESYINNRFGPDNSLTAADKKIEELREGCEEALALIQQALQDSEENAIKTVYEKILMSVENLVQVLDIASTWATVREVEQDLCVVEANPILSPDVTTADDIIKNGNISDDSEIPLVIAYNKAMSLKEALENSLETIDYISNEILIKDDTGIMASCNELRAKIQALFNTLINKMKVITTHKEYRYQVLVYEKDQLNEELKRLKQEIGNLQGLVDQQRRQIESLRMQSYFHRY
jgi:hypothetical protein